MQAGGVTTTHVYNITGRILIDGRDIGAHVQSVSVDREIPSGLPSSTGFTAATGEVTATWGDTVDDRVHHPWGTDPLWPPRPQARVEVILADGSGNEWTQFKGVVVDPSGSDTSRTISFGVRDNYRALDTLVTLPALSNLMPSLKDTNTHRYVGLHTTWVTDRLLRTAGRYATPAMGAYCFVSVPFQGSTWPERGECLTSVKQEADSSGQAYPNWRKTSYGMCVHNVTATYAPWTWSGLNLNFNRPMEMTQEIVPVDGGSTFLRVRCGSGDLGIGHATGTVYARYYPSSGSPVDLVSRSKGSATRVAVRYSRSGSTLTAQLRLRNADGSLSTVTTGTATIASGDLAGEVNQIWANGTGAQGAFQAGFPTTEWGPLSATPSAVIHASVSGRNSLTGLPTQVNGNVLDLLNAQADAEFAQWWIDELDVLQWWDRGLLASRSTVGTLTGQDHVKQLNWSHSHDSARRRVHVKYRDPQATTRWRTNLTLWQGSGDTLEAGDTSETFVNVPNDEIWLGIDMDPVRYSANTGNYWAINRGIKSVYGGIAVSDSGNERVTNSIIPSLRRVTDETFVFDHTVTNLQSGEQAALELPDAYDTDTALWQRRRGEGLPILRGKKRVVFVDEVATSSITGDSAAPDYTHEPGWWIQSATYAGQTADYAAEALTQPRPTLDGLDIMPVLALQAGDRVRVVMPDRAELDITGVVTGNRVRVNLATGTMTQSINLLPTNVTSLARRWSDFGRVRAGDTWDVFGADRSGDTWDDFGADPLA